jgi:hypothetical protein
MPELPASVPLSGPKPWLIERLAERPRRAPIPEAIANLIGSLRELDPSTMLGFKARQSCVYFLIHRGEIVYVGKTVRLPSRVGYHIDDQKRFDRVLYFHVELSNAPRVEISLINLLTPKYNYPARTGLTTADHQKALTRYRKALGILEGP